MNISPTCQSKHFTIPKLLRCTRAVTCFDKTNHTSLVPLSLGLHPCRSETMSTRSSSSSSFNQHGSFDDPNWPLLDTHVPGHDQTRSQHQHDSQQTNRPKAPKKRDTHFLCFPLTTRSAVPELAQSLETFQRITTRQHPRQRLMEQRRQEEESRANFRAEQALRDGPVPVIRQVNEPWQETEEYADLPSGRNSQVDDELKSIPPAAHRPAGTFHLTLGTMDLSEPAEMYRAISLLHSLDLRQMLHDISSIGTASSDNTDLQPQKRTQTSPVLRRRSTFDPQPDRPTTKRLSSETPSLLNDFSGATELSDSLARAGRGVGRAGRDLKEAVEKSIETIRRSISPPSITLRRRSRGTSVSSPLSNPPSDPSDPSKQAHTSILDVMTSHPSPQPSTHLEISLSGLSTFPPSSKNTRVFYAPPHDPTSRLIPFANAIRQRFRDEGFVTESRELTLHATVANMSYAARNKRGRGGKNARPEMVDARAVVELFNGGGAPTAEQRSSSEFIWARNIVVDRVRICKMGAERSDDPMLGQIYPPTRLQLGNAVGGPGSEDEMIGEVIFGGLPGVEMAY